MLRPAMHRTEQTDSVLHSVHFDSCINYPLIFMCLKMYLFANLVLLHAFALLSYYECLTAAERTVLK